MDQELHRNEFLRVFNSLCERHPKFSVWSDFISLSAYSFSNALEFRQDREDQYLSIIKKYSKDEANKFPELLAHTTNAMDSDRHQDFLGQLYMDFGFGDKKKGEYFSPYSVAELMTSLTASEGDDNSGYVTVNDPCCGSGVMFIAMANKLIKDGKNHHFDMLAIGSDSDPCIALMCYIQLSLLGCAGYVCIRNALTEPITGKLLQPPEDAFKTPMLYHEIWATRKLLEKIRI